MNKRKSDKHIKDLLLNSLLGELSEMEFNKLMNTTEIKTMMFQQWEENHDIKTKIPDYNRIFDKITANTSKELRNGKIIEFQEYKNKYRSTRKLYLLFFGIASALFIAFFLVAGLYISDSTGRNACSEVIAPRGQKSEVVLVDGTIAWLNSGSTIRYSGNYNKRNREVELTGEAYFNVAKNNRLPFVVKTSNIKVRALGTHFNLMAYPEDETLSVTLVEGKAQINAPNNKTINLSPNQKAIYNKYENNFRIENVDPIFSISWKDNVLKFDNESWPDILTHLERWYDVKFYYPDDVLGDQRFTLTIKTESLREVLDLIKISTPIKFTIEVDSVYITLLN